MDAMTAPLQFSEPAKPVPADVLDVLAERADAGDAYLIVRGDVGARLRRSLPKDHPERTGSLWERLAG
ncbi:hypothetical protein C5C95_11245 [Rathayibacter sp. AY1B7]|nr:hypothetical protein C5C95_11245 [Rathayibacter sp. AY1B7]